MSKFFFSAMAMFLLINIAVAQIPVEVFGGNQKATIDLMFFRFVKNNKGQNSKFLFFNRNRSSIDYNITKSSNLPQFGFTEAFSYNHEKLKGFAPVMVASILNRGVYPKVGIQFAKTQGNFTVFSWAVIETMNEANFDFFLLTRYTPKLTNQLNLFSQIELINSFPVTNQNITNFVQRFRLGFKLSAFQIGTGLDLNQTKTSFLVNTNNFGFFTRYEF